MDNLGLFFAILGAAFAVGFSGIGSARGVGLVGEASAGLLSEDTGMFRKIFILQVLPGTQGFYGFLIALFVFIKLGIINGAVIALSWSDGLTIFASCLPVALVGYFSAVYQGRVAAASVSLIAKQPTQLVKGMMMAGMAETYSLIAFLVSFIAISNITLGV